MTKPPRHFGLVRTGDFKSGELELAKTVLLDAVGIILCNFEYEHLGHAYRRLALRWVTCSDQWEWGPMSFDNVCRGLKLSPSYVRRQLLALAGIENSPATKREIESRWWLPMEPRRARGRGDEESNWNSMYRLGWLLYMGGYRGGYRQPTDGMIEQMKIVERKQRDADQNY